MVKAMTNAGMIVYAAHTGIVLTITPIIIALLAIKVATIDIKANEVDPLIIDLPLLEDANFGIKW